MIQRGEEANKVIFLHLLHCRPSSSPQVGHNSFSASLLPHTRPRSRPNPWDKEVQGSRYLASCASSWLMYYYFGWLSEWLADWLGSWVAGPVAKLLLTHRHWDSQTFLGQGDKNMMFHSRLFVSEQYTWPSTLVRMFFESIAGVGILRYLPGSFDTSRGLFLFFWNQFQWI